MGGFFWGCHACTASFRFSDFPREGVAASRTNRLFAACRRPRPFVKKLVTLHTNHRVLSSKAKKALSIFLKAAILLGVAWVLYNKLSDHQNLRDFNRLLSDLGTE